MNIYFTRRVYPEIVKYLESTDILLLIGARQVGKTTMMRALQKHTVLHTTSWITLEDPDIRARLDTHPEELFRVINRSSSGKQIVFIDEIQYLKNPTNFLKYLYDQYSPQLKLVVTGSSSFYIDQKFRDSLIGRKKVFTLYPLDFREFLSFHDYREGGKKSDSRLLSQLFADYITYGGYPGIVTLPTAEEKEIRLREYALDYVKKDIFEAGIVEERKYLLLIQILAGQIGNQVNMSELARTLGLSQPTIEKFIFTLQKTFHVGLVRPFYRNLRKELTKMPKAYFYDTGIRNAFLGDFSPIETRADKGSTLENIIFRYFLEKNMLDDIQYWRTQSQDEIDFIIAGKKAYECKFVAPQTHSTSLKNFREAYPQIPVEYITFADILERWKNLS